MAKKHDIAIGSIKQVAAAGGDTTIKEINVCPYVDCGKAERLGMLMDVELNAIIEDYIVTYIKTK